MKDDRSVKGSARYASTLTAASGLETMLFLLYVKQEKNSFGGRLTAASAVCCDSVDV